MSEPSNRNPDRNRRPLLGTRRRRPFEWFAEKVIFLVSLTAILMILLIFLFTFREAMPIFLGRASSVGQKKVIPAADFGKLSHKELADYLDLTLPELEKKDEETLKLLMEIREEAARETKPDKDAALNTVAWRFLFFPYQWSGYDKPVYIWQPVSQIKKLNLIPLIIGSLKTTFVALAFSVPIALAAAIYVSQLANPRLKEWIKPAIELLAGIPSVVLGFFALIVLASVLQRLFGYQSRLNAFVAGIALGLAVIPVVFSISEDALTSVPRSYLQAALALGATRWRAAWHVMLPAAAPGVFAAIILGFGRAVGETMIVLMASGNASILSASLFDSTRSITATIAAELAETVFGGTHYRLLFAIGCLLFAVTFASNLAGGFIMQNVKARLEGRKA